MKVTVTLFALVGLCLAAAGQVNVVPYAGLNSTKVYDGISYDKGGAFVVSGVEIELGIKPKTHRNLTITAAIGASYLRNGFYYSRNFAYAALDFYTQKIADLKTEYVHVPLTLRLNWQPFPLVEEWKVFAGVGAAQSVLIKSTLEEKYTEVFINSDPLAPPQVTSYADSRDVTHYGNNTGIFSRAEIGMKYKRLQLTFRLSKSMTDLYRTGLENDWNVPDEHSWYIESYQEAGKIVEKYSELVVGVRL